MVLPGLFLKSLPVELNLSFWSCVGGTLAPRGSRGRCRKLPPPGVTEGPKGRGVSLVTPAGVGAPSWPEHSCSGSWSTSGWQRPPSKSSAWWRRPSGSTRTRWRAPGKRFPSCGSSCSSCPFSKPKQPELEAVGVAEAACGC